MKDLAIIDVFPNFTYRLKSDRTWTVRQGGTPRRDLEAVVGLMAEDIRRRLGPADGDPAIAEVLEMAKRVQGNVRQLPPNQSKPGVVY